MHEPCPRHRRLPLADNAEEGSRSDNLKEFRNPVRRIPAELEIIKERSWKIHRERCAILERRGKHRYKDRR